MQISKEIFRAYDIRGVYGKDLDESVMAKIGYCLGDEKRKVVVGQDVRRSSPKLADALVSGLLAKGTDVIRTGTTSFGVTLYAGWKLNRDETHFVTASHLPAEWNGLKLYHGDGEGFQESQIIALRDAIVSTPDTEFVNKSTEEMDFKKDYIEFMLKNFRMERRLKVALDCGGGSACLSAPDVFNAMGFITEKIFCDVNPDFTDRDSEPSDEVLGALKSSMRGQDFGVAFDGDGDRVAIVDDTGKTLGADQVGVVIAKHMPKGVVLANIECSMLVERVLQPLGYEVVRFPVGHTFMTQQAKQRKAVLAFESSGHMVMPHYFLFDDAMLIPLKLAEILSKTDKKLSELVAALPVYENKRLKFDCADDKKFGVLSKLKERYSREYPKVNTMDGIRVEMEHGWALIRCSNTSPLIRLTVEADSKEELDRIAKKFSEDLKCLI